MAFDEGEFLQKAKAHFPEMSDDAAKAFAKELGKAFKKALQAEAADVAIATHGVRALGSVMRGDLLGATKQAAGALAFLGPEGKVAAAGIELAVGALEAVQNAAKTLFNTALETTAKYNPGLITQYNDVLDDLSAAIGEGLYPIIRDIIPHLRDLADWFHENSEAIRKLTTNLMISVTQIIEMAKWVAKHSPDQMLFDAYLKARGIQPVAETPRGSSVGLAAQQASYSDIFEAGDQRRLAIAGQQADAAAQTADNTAKANEWLALVAKSLAEKEKWQKVLDALDKNKKK